MKFDRFCHFLDLLEATTKRLEMYDILAQLFKEIPPADIDKAIYLSQGQLKPPFYNIELGVSDKLLIRAISVASNKSTKVIDETFKQTGDIGITALQALSGRQGYDLSMAEVYDELMAIAERSGSKSLDIKLELIANLLRGLTPPQAKHLCRFITGKLRLGIGDPTVIEALSLMLGDRAFKTDIEHAYNLCSDLGHVAKVLKTGGVDDVRAIDVNLGSPVRMMLCERVSSEQEIIERLGRSAIEVKYDGIRLQCHKNSSSIKFFSRNLQEMTYMFPELVSEVVSKVPCKTAIFEGEAVAYDDATGKLLPFQMTIQRKRKHKVDMFVKALPLRFFVFDLLYQDGRSFISLPYQARKEALNRLFEGISDIILPSATIITQSTSEIKEFFAKAINQGLEGIIAKKLDAPYSAGSRNFNWVKLKKHYKDIALSDSIDVCIVGYFYGKGARTKFGIGGILTAVYDKASDAFYTVSKIGSGFSEDELAELQKLLSETTLPHKPSNVISEITPDVWVMPKYVISVICDEITRSPIHTAGKDEEGLGYALRFPRTVGFIRQDKTAWDATTVDELISIFNSQTQS